MQKARLVWQRVGSVLRTEDAAILAGCGVGIVEALKIDHPLGSLFAGAILGTMCGMGANIVHGMLPRRITPIIPIACACFALKHFSFHPPSKPTKPLIDIDIETTSKEKYL